MTTKPKGSSWNSVDNLGYVTITDAGCIGDGVTDNTAAMNAVLALGKPVFIPVGVFLCGPITVPANTLMFGGGSTAVIKLKGSSVSSMLTIGSGTVLDNFAVDGNKASMSNPNLHGVVIANAANVQLKNLTITNTSGDGINITGAAPTGIKIKGCEISGFTKNGITLDNGTNVLIESCITAVSDIVAAPGDGISLAVGAVGYSTNLVTISDCISRNNSGRGIAVVGAGSKNVSNVTIKGSLVSANTGHGIHLLTAQQVLVNGCIAKSNNGDGIRLEGDVINSRISECIADSNAGFGIREIIAGATPNNNGLIYSVAVGNTTSNVITKIGAGSFVI